MIPLASARAVTAMTAAALPVRRRVFQGTFIPGGGHWPERSTVYAKEISTPPRLQAISASPAASKRISREYFSAVSCGSVSCRAVRSSR